MLLSSHISPGARERSSSRQNNLFLIQQNQSKIICTTYIFVYRHFFINKYTRGKRLASTQYRSQPDLKLTPFYQHSHPQSLGLTEISAEAVDNHVKSTFSRTDRNQCRGCRNPYLLLGWVHAPTSRKP